jgi:hypothetical protein
LKRTTAVSETAFLMAVVVVATPPHYFTCNNGNTAPRSKYNAAECSEHGYRNNSRRSNIYY